MLDWLHFWSHVPECHAACALTESAVKKVDHHYLAAAVYLMIILVTAATVVRAKYFDKIFYKLRPYGVDAAGAKDVWRFTLVIFLANGILHAVKLTDWDFLTAAPVRAFSRITVFQIVYLLTNASLWFWAVRLYNRDVRPRNIELGDEDASFRASDESTPFGKRKATAIAYFSFVSGLFLFDDWLSEHWEQFDASSFLALLLANFQTWHGWSVIVAPLAIIVVIAPAVLAAIFFQDRARDAAWSALLLGLRSYLPVAVLLLAGLAAVTLPLSANGGASNGAERSMIKGSASGQSAGRRQVRLRRRVRLRCKARLRLKVPLRRRARLQRKACRHRKGLLQRKGRLRQKGRMPSPYLIRAKIRRSAVDLPADKRWEPINITQPRTNLRKIVASPIFCGMFCWALDH